MARQTELSEADIAKFYQLFASTEKTISLLSQGVNQSTSGTDKGNAIINCHLATGRIGKTGMGPFSITGQPNAMGGREVGGLSNQLAAHMEIDKPEHHDRLSRFWNTGRLTKTAGRKTVEMFQAIERGETKAVWIIATNPVVSVPDADRVKAALQKCELVVVSEVEQQTDCTELADVLLPALAWGEKDGTGPIQNGVSAINGLFCHHLAKLKPIGGCLKRWVNVSSLSSNFSMKKRWICFVNTRCYRRLKIMASGILISVRWLILPNSNMQHCNRRNGR